MRASVSAKAPASPSNWSSYLPKTRIDVLTFERYMVYSVQGNEFAILGHHGGT